MDEQERGKLWSMIKSVKVAMLTTENEGALRARPMAVIQTDFNGELWFFTRDSAPKVGEVEADRHVGVTFADPGGQNYVSMSGTASVERDRALIDQHWSEPLATWFPKGKDDPDIALLRVAVTGAEYWDAPSSTLLHAYGYVKSKLTGAPPKGGENEKIALG